jgi:hypothetical protein
MDFFVLGINHQKFSLSEVLYKGVCIKYVSSKEGGGQEIVWFLRYEVGGFENHEKFLTYYSNLERS